MRVPLPRRRATRFAAAATLSLLAVAILYGRQVAERARLVAPAPTPILYDRHGAFLTRIGHADGARLDYGYWVVDPLPKRVVRATLALEDRRFWSHPGVDPIAVARAAWQNLASGHRRSGASTIAMQVARMQRQAARTLWAKAVEAGTAVALTLRYGREALLAHYLRVVPYGNGNHGIGHAARWYFDKPVQDLSWAEIALLSAIPQAPAEMNPLHPAGLARAVRRGHRMLDELARQRVIDAPTAALAHRQLAAIRLPAPPHRPDALHAVLRLRSMLEETGAELSPSDPRLRTTLDLDLQADVKRLMRRALAEWRPAGAEQVAVMVVQRGTHEAHGAGEVLASVGSADYGDRRSGAIDFTRAVRSPGSTLKPFVYALALERDILKPSDVMADLPEGASGIGNADGHFLGPMLPRQALANSRNIPATRLLAEVGLDRTFRFFHELGLHDLDSSADSFGLSMAIGSLPTSLDRLLRAYGALADDGMIGDLVWYEGQRRPLPRRVLSADTARLVTLFLADPLARLPSFPRYGTAEYPFPVALKTGTSQGYRDAWVVAWSERYMVGVWVGRGDAGTMRQLTGGRAAARLAQEILLGLHGATPGDLTDTGFRPPEHRVPAELCVLNGKRSAGGCGETLMEWVRPDEMPPLDDSAVIRHEPGGDRLSLAVPAVHRAWAKAAGYPVRNGAAAADAMATATGRPGADGAVHLSIVAPEHNSRIWRNPETPAALDRLALKAVVAPAVPQVVWYVDGEPYKISDPDKPVYWPITPGAHRFELRLPYGEAAARPVRIVVE